MWEAIAAIAGIVSVIVTGTGLWFVARQIKDGRRANKAQFISNLESEFTTLSEVITFVAGEIWSSSGTGHRIQGVSKIIFYLSFFGKIEYLIKLGVLDFPTIDQLFAFRFFLVTNNIHTQQQILYSSIYKGYWLDVYRLHRKWSQFRRERGLDILFEKEAMLKYDALEEMEQRLLKT